MSLNEVKLTVAIEDPTKREQKEYMGIEVASRPVPQTLLKGRETRLACAQQQGLHPCRFGWRYQLCILGRQSVMAGSLLASQKWMQRRASDGR